RHAGGPLGCDLLERVQQNVPALPQQNGDGTEDKRDGRDNGGLRNRFALEPVEEDESHRHNRRDRKRKKGEGRSDLHRSAPGETALCANETYVILASAWRIRSKHTSRPSTAMVSNNGGAFFLPHTCTRIGWNIGPAFTPSSAAAPRSACSSASCVNSTPGSSSSAFSSTRRASAASPVDSPFLGGISSVGSYAGSSFTKKKSAAPTPSRSSFIRSWISGVTSSSFSARASKPASAKNGPSRPASSAGSSARRCSAFSQTALASNGSSSVKFTTALARFTPSSVKSCVSSSILRNSRSFLGDHPSRQRKLMNAWGRKPASR